MRPVLGTIIASCVVAAAACAAPTDSPTSPTDSPASPGPFTATLTAAGPFHVNDLGFGTPNERFDFGITSEAIDTALARKHIEISSITVSGTGISQSDFAVFDVEVHLSGTSIGLPVGQATSSAMNPDRGITRTAAARLHVVPFRDSIYNASRNSSIDLSFKVDFSAPSNATTTPPLYNLKSVPVTSLDLTDGLHMQLFFWTGSEYTDALFRNLSVIVKGIAS